MEKKKISIAAIFFILFLILIVLIKTVDVAAVGPEGTSIGLSSLNTAFHDLTGINIGLYEATDFLGYIALGTVGIFGIIGLIQWIRRKNIFKVDQEILAMGILFIIDLLIYVFFEKVIVNYRPVIMPGAEGPEASFPSSHTLMTVTVMGSVAMVLKKYIANDQLRKILTAVCIIIAAAMLIGRAVCGVHWLTDIIGGQLLSISLLLIYSAEKS